MPPRLTDDQAVIVNTGGPDLRAVVVSLNPPIPALKGSVLVRFTNNTRQWMPRENVRPDPHPVQF